MAPPNHNLTIGALLIGMGISTFLFGIVTLQVHIYMRRFAADRLILKVLVAIVWALEFAHTVAVTNGLYFMVISQYTEPREGRVQRVDSAFRIAVLFSGCIATVVQAYFADRLRIISGRLVVPLIFYALAAVRFMGWVWASVHSIMTGLRLEREGGKDSSWVWPIVVLLGAGAFLDVALAAFVCYYFSTSRAKAGFTAPVMDKLMFWSIQNGLLTGLAGLTTAICLQAMPDNFVWIAVFMILTRLFSNSFLASLNARQSLRKYGHQPSGSTDPIIGYQAGYGHQPITLTDPIIGNQAGYGHQPSTLTEPIMGYHARPPSPWGAQSHLYVRADTPSTLHNGP